MEKLAAISGLYKDIVFKYTLGVARITIEIDSTAYQDFIDIFGPPDSTSPVSVALARLEKIGPDTGFPPVLVKPINAEAKQDKPRTFTRSQAAYLKLNDYQFVCWLEENTTSEKDCQLGDDFGNWLLCENLGITSKKELDTLPHKGLAWDALLTSYEHRNDEPENVRPAETAKERT